MHLRDRPPLTRGDEGRIVAGVAAGLARHLDVAPGPVRLVFVLTTLLGGVGAVVYLAAWLLMPTQSAAPPSPPRAAGAPVPADCAERPDPPSSLFSPRDPVQVVALAVVGLGLLLLVRVTSPWFPDRLVWPLLLAALGFAVAWSRPSAAPGVEEPVAPPDWPLVRDLPPAARESLAVLLDTRRSSLARAALGAALIGAGVAMFLAAADVLVALRDGLLALILLGAGITIVLGPWLWRLAGELVEERRSRIRSQERAEMAAHLHDSVLQTLAMVQRRADDPRAVVTLARQQERELRAWLLGGQQPVAVVAPTLGVALEGLAAEVEETHGIPVEVVRVRDRPLDDSLQPLLLAAREAMTNAARHSTASQVSVYLEVGTEAITVFVRDTGCGFDPEAVPPDRRGVAESIEGRMARGGGRATVHSAPGEGTEVELVMPALEERTETGGGNGGSDADGGRDRAGEAGS